MDQIITFNKTFQDRLTDYKYIFGETKLSQISEIKKQWSIYIELQLLEGSGWQAFWKIPHSICQERNIPYPTIVLVQICEIHYNELEAFVEVIATQEDMILECKKYNASFIHLWPTKQQSGNINVVPMADILDNLRFFYNNIVMPWDYLDTNYCNFDFEERLGLYYNLKDNIIPKSRTVKARTLLTEIQNEFEYFDKINLKLDKCDSSLIELNTKILELKVEYDVLEIFPINNSEKNQQNNNWLIFQTKCKSIKDHIEYLKLIPINNKKYQTSISLENALELALPNDVIFINEGHHLINSLKILKDGITLKNISNDPTKTSIDTTKENSLFEFTGNKLLIENLHLNISNARCAIITHCGEVMLNNCVISGHKCAEHAIIALPGAKITLNNCKISGFNVGVYASPNSFINLNDCNVFDVSTAIKFLDDSNVQLFNCTFDKIARNSINFETSNEDSQTGDEDVLKANSCISIKGCKFENSSTAVIIGNKEDIFNENI